MAKVVLVATPLMPLMLTWAPRVPSRNSRLRKNFSSSRERPAGSFFFMVSKKRASLRSSPVALRTSSPGRGGTKISGSKRVAETMAASLTSAGRTPSSIRKTSESNRAPSWRARTWETTP